MHRRHPHRRPPDDLVAEVRTLSAAADNDARFDALTALLKAHGVPFTVEPFTLDKPPAAGPNQTPDPRTRGRNIVVSLGDGAEQVVVGAHYDAKWMADKTLSRGAVDNGASSVMLVHLAAGAAARAARPAHHLRVVRHGRVRPDRLDQVLEAHPTIALPRC